MLKLMLLKKSKLFIHFDFSIYLVLFFIKYTCLIFHLLFCGKSGVSLAKSVFKSVILSVNHTGTNLRDRAHFALQTICFCRRWLFLVGHMSLSTVMLCKYTWLFAEFCGAAGGILFCSSCWQPLEGEAVNLENCGSVAGWDESGKSRM